MNNGERALRIVTTWADRITYERRPASLAELAVGVAAVLDRVQAESFLRGIRAALAREAARAAGSQTAAPARTELCAACEFAADIDWPRIVDGECLECGARLCAAHLVEHFIDVHCVGVALDHGKGRRLE